MASEFPTDDTLAVAFLTGGHPYDVPVVLTALDTLPGIRFYPHEVESFVSDPATIAAYDAAVFFNFHGHDIGLDLTDGFTERVAEAIPEMGAAGVGIVPLHHGIAAFPDVPAWETVTGLPGTALAGAYIDQQFTIEVADEDHPITGGYDAFHFHDETYEYSATLDGDSNVLLRTDHDPSAEPIAWTRTYEDSRVFAYQSGHGRNAYTDATFRTLLTRGIWWSAGRDAVGVNVV